MTLIDAQKSKSPTATKEFEAILEAEIFLITSSSMVFHRTKIKEQERHRLNEMDRHMDLVHSEGTHQIAKYEGPLNVTTASSNETSPEALHLKSAPVHPDVCHTTFCMELLYDLIAKQKNKSQAAKEEFQAPTVLVAHSLDDDENGTRRIIEEDQEITDWPDDANVTKSKNGEHTNKIDHLKEEIESALQELSEFDVDIFEYLVELRNKYTHTDYSNERDYKETVYWIMVIAIIWVIVKQVQRRRASASKDNEWHCFNGLLSRNHAEIRLRDLRRIISKYHEVLGHIKTAGKGRTKIKIIDDLRAFQMGLNV